MRRRMVETKLGLMLACSCGDPPENPQYVVQIEQGKLRGERMLCHERCLKPDPIQPPKGNPDA